MQLQSEQVQALYRIIEAEMDGEERRVLTRAAETIIRRLNRQEAQTIGSRDATSVILTAAMHAD